jgi:hypothetical protein
MPKSQILVWPNLLKMTKHMLAPGLQEQCKFLVVWSEALLLVCHEK